MTKAHGAQELVEAAQMVRLYLQIEGAVREKDGEIEGYRTTADICLGCGFPQGWWEDIKLVMLDLGYPIVGCNRGYYLGQGGESGIYFRYLLRQLKTRTVTMERSIEHAEAGGLLNLIIVYSEEKLGDPLAAAWEWLRQWREGDRIRYLLSGEKEVAKIAGGNDKDND